jgi:hypothetical protein
MQPIVAVWKQCHLCHFCAFNNLTSHLPSIWVAMAAGGAYRNLPVVDDPQVEISGGVSGSVESSTLSQ